MAPIRIIGANNQNTTIELELPVDIDGQWAFTDAGKPVKGVEPVIITVPRFDFMPVGELKQLQANISVVEESEQEGEDAQREVIFVSLKPFVTDQEYELISGLALGTLQHISQVWAEQSGVPLGELLASNSSSANTRRQSNTTSSPKPVSGSATSGRR